LWFVGCMLNVEGEGEVRYVCFVLFEKEEV